MAELTIDYFIANTEQLLKLDEVLTDHEKSKHFNMRNYATKTDCGTVCCLAGFAGMQPYFQEIGFVTRFNKVSGEGFVYQDEDAFFGPGAYDRMFSANLSSVWPDAMERVRDHLKHLYALKAAA